MKWKLALALLIMLSLVYATNQRPVAIIDGPEEVDVKDLVFFSGQDSYDSDGNIIEYYWFFGDGDTAKGRSVYHIYRSEGTYTVYLVVTDNQLDKDTDWIEVRVENFTRTTQEVSKNGSVNYTISLNVTPSSIFKEVIGDDTEVLPVEQYFKIVEYDLLDEFDVTRDYYYDPNSDTTTYTLNVKSRLNEPVQLVINEAIPKTLASALYQVRLTPEPMRRNTEDGSVIWRVDFRPGGTFRATITLDRFIDIPEIQNIAPPEITFPGAEGIIEGSVTVAYEEPEGDILQSATGFVSTSLSNPLVAAVIVIVLILWAAWWKRDFFGRIIEVPPLEEPAPETGVKEKREKIFRQLREPEKTPVSELKKELEEEGAEAKEALPDDEELRALCVKASEKAGYLIAPEYQNDKEVLRGLIDGRLYSGKYFTDKKV